MSVFHPIATELRTSWIGSFVAKRRHCAGYSITPSARVLLMILRRPPRPVHARPGRWRIGFESFRGIEFGVGFAPCNASIMST
jgi:hypothetical protein